MESYPNEREATTQFFIEWASYARRQKRVEYDF